MDGFDFDAGPPEFQQVRSLAQANFFLAGVGWLAYNYFLIRSAYRDSTAGVSLIPLCNNFAWELTFALVYCPPDLATKSVGRAWLFINCFVVYTMVRFTGRSQSDSLFLPQYTPLFVVVGIGFFFSAHWTLAAHLGGIRALYWSGLGDLMIMHISALNLLVQRGNTLGSSYGMWLSRFAGTLFAFVGVYLRAFTWPDKWGWSNNIVMTWFVAAWLLLDIVYGFFFWLTRRVEQQARFKSKDG